MERGKIARHQRTANSRLSGAAKSLTTATEKWELPTLALHMWRPTPHSSGSSSTQSSAKMEEFAQQKWVRTCFAHER